MTKEQKKQEFTKDIKSLTEEEVCKKWNIGKSLFRKGKKKLGLQDKQGRKKKLDFLDL